MKVHCSYEQLTPIETLVEHPKNPNQHPEKQIQLLAKIMKHQGWRSPVTVSARSGYIVAGHGRLMAARLNGWKEVPVDLQDFDNEADEYAHMIADNKIQELSESSDELITELAIDIGPDFDLQLLGVEDLQIPGITFDPSGTEEEQGELDKTKVKILECPRCHGTFEAKEAKTID